MKSAVGLGLRHSFHSYVLENKPAVPFFEVITENYLYFDGGPRNFLKKIRQDYSLAFHGVSLSIGSLEPVRSDYLIQLKKMVEEFQPLWVSDHLCWTFNGPENSHDLLPVPFTKNSLERIVRKTQQVQEFLGRKIYLENPSAYVDFSSNQYLEEDFIKELCQKSGCGLLLDLNNLVVNQYNLGYDPKNYLTTIKNCDIKQIHLAGHTIKEKVRIDTHDSPISQEVLDLLPLAKHQWPEAKPMIEWDDKIPAVEDLLSLRLKIDNNWENAQYKEEQFNKIASKNNAHPVADDDLDHHLFWNLLKTETYIDSSQLESPRFLNTELPTPAYVGMNVYSSAYYNRLIEVLQNTFPLLKKALADYFTDAALAYLKKHPSHSNSIDFIGEKFADFLSEETLSFELGVNKLIISDIARFEFARNVSQTVFLDCNQNLQVKFFTEHDWDSKKIKLKSDVQVVKFNSGIHKAIESLENSEAPEIPDLQDTYYVFVRDETRSSFKAIDAELAVFLNSFASFQTFTENIKDNSLEAIKKRAQFLIENESLFCISAIDHI